MNILEIIGKLRASRVAPRLEAGQLKLTGETGNLTGEFIAIIKAHKAELIAFLAASARQLHYEAIPVAETRDHYPLSSAQRRIWVLSQFEGGSTAYNIVSAFHLQGVVVKAHLAAAFGAVVARHESLRTVFREVDGEPVQVILPEVPFALEEADLAGRPGGQAALEAEVALFNNRPFDLERGPLLRVKLVTLGDGAYALLFGLHHIVGDGWSIGVLVREVMAHYEACCQGETPRPAPLPVQYKDYAAWQERRLAGEEGARSRQYWQERFAQSPDPLQLPADQPRPEVKSFRGAAARFYFDAGQYGQMQAFCKASHVTLFNFLHAVSTVLLYKYSGQRHLVVGTPVSGRNHFDLEHQVGLYVNTVALPSVVRPEQSFAEYLRTLAAGTLQDFGHQHYPFDQVVEDLGVKRDTGRNPLFDVMIALQNTAFGDGSIDITRQHGFTLSFLDGYLYPAAQGVKKRIAAKFDLTFNFFNEPGDRFLVEIEYSRALFSDERIDQLFGMLTHLTAQVLQDPARPVGRLGLLDDRTRDLTLRTYNAPVTPVEGNGIPGLLRESFARHAARTALRVGDQALTYAELDDLSGRLAACLQTLTDTSANPLIGIMTGRTEWTLIALLGILKAGAAYVPIDVSYPQSRIDFLLGDAAPAVLLVDAKGLPLVPVTYAGRLLHLTADREAILAQPPLVAAPADLMEKTAYLIYTSGSTGRPKGVEICHRNAVAFLRWAAEEFAETPFETLYAATSYCFDLSVFEFFFPLLAGKTIRLLDSALAIPDHLPHDRAVMLNTVPSVVRTFLDLRTDLSPVVALNMAGEAVPRRFKQELPYRTMEVRNLYGPSEDTTYSTNYRFRDDGYDTVPIGRPVGYTQLYILDECLNLLPPGVDGEIYLSGQSVAKGYYNRPDLTRERFLPNPFVPGLPMYRTGDVGRWLPDGQVDFIGRIDDQVKVRGYRIELGEIQFLLEKMEGVHQAVAVVRDVADEKNIVAYWTGAPDVQPDRLKEALAAQLPAYAVPAVFVRLDEIPLNANGKVDKKALPQPTVAAGRQVPVVEPGTALEYQLYKAWKAVLKTDGFGVKHNFFDLGGNSLKAARLKALVAKDLRKALTMNEIFQYPTILQLAEVLARKEQGAFADIRPVEARPHYPLSFSQERLWVLTQFAEASRAYHMPAAFRVAGALRTDLLEAAIALVADRHEALRTVFVEADGVPVQQILDRSQLDLRIETLAVPHDLTDDVLIPLLQRKWAEPFPLHAGPLLRTFLVRGAGGEQVLSFNMHHLISDGWSVGVLFAEVMEAYHALLHGRELRLPPLEIQFRDYAVWQRRELAGPGLEAHRAYWREQFAGGDLPLDLPADFPRPAVKTYRGSSRNHRFDPALAAGLHERAGAAGASLFMVLAGALQVLLSKYTGQETITLGTPVAGRDHYRLEPQIGFYANTLALRADVPGGLSFSAFLATQKDALLRALEHQVYPFEMLLEDLQLKRDVSQSPLFEVMLVLQNNDVPGAGPAPADALRLEKLDVPGGTAKYDLTFSFVPDAGGLALELEYNTDLYRPETAGRMIGHLETLLTRIVQHPAVPVRELDVLGEAEKRQLRTFGASLKAAVACATRLPAWEMLLAASPEAHPFVGVLDEDGRPVPVGVKGEICLAGPGPGGDGLPAGKWVENPFGDGWLCRTGEGGKWRADGTLQCLGPADHRVHIRGFRVEPAEIESVLRSLPGVDAAVVVARTNPDAGKELVAYFTGPQPLDAVQLRSRLVQILPAYLVPAYLVQLDALPLAPGGAVDSGRLPDPAGFGARSGTAYVAPRNALETQLAAIWAEVLDRQAVGVRDNFFDLGGHSLKATRVISKVHEALGIKIDLKDLFIDPTIEHLANYLDTLRWIDAEVEVAGDEGNEVIL